MQPSVTCTTGKFSCTTSTIETPNKDRLTDESLAILKQFVDEAITRPAPLTIDFEKGFKEKGNAGQIYAMLYADVVSMKTLLQIVKEPNESSKEEFLGIAWHGFLQCVYMAWLAHFAKLFVKSEINNHKKLDFQRETLIIQTTNAEDFKDASDFIADDCGEYFYHVLRDHGETVYSVESYAASISNGLEMLRTFEHAFMFSYDRCKEDDDEQSKHYFLSMAKAAYLVRSLALKWLLNGVTGHALSKKPLSSDLSIGKSEIKKKTLKELEWKVEEALLGLNFSELAFELLARAQSALKPDAAAFVMRNARFKRFLNYFGLRLGYDGVMLNGK